MIAKAHPWFSITVDEMPPRGGFFRIRDRTVYSYPLLSVFDFSYFTTSIMHIASSHFNVLDRSLRAPLLKSADVFHMNPLQGSMRFPFHVNSPRSALSPLLWVPGSPPHCRQGRGDSFRFPNIPRKACPSVLPVQVAYPYRLIHA